MNGVVDLVEPKKWCTHVLFACIAIIVVQLFIFSDGITHHIEIICTYGVESNSCGLECSIGVVSCVRTARWAAG